MSVNSESHLFLINKYAQRLSVFFGLLMLELPAKAGLLGDGQVARLIPFSLRNDDKPMIDARIGGKNGVLMIDNGTPESIFLNRAAINLPDGQFVSRGFAASGQPIEVQIHPAPSVEIGGKWLLTPNRLRSGDFGFTAPGLGADFLGFIGMPMLKDDAFLIHAQRHLMMIFKVSKDGSLEIGNPPASDVMVSVKFMMCPGEQPTIAASLGSLPILTDFDTGDSGTLYATSSFREMLMRQGLLKPVGERWLLSGLTIGGVPFDATSVRIVEAGSNQDVRVTGKPDQLRLGGRFLFANPCLWNIPAGSLCFLKPSADLLNYQTRQP